MSNDADDKDYAIVGLITGAAILACLLVIMYLSGGLG